MPDSYNGILISDFTIDNLAGLLQNDASPPIVECFTAPYDQVMSVLLDQNHDCWSRKYDFAVVWTRPEAVSPEFGGMLSFTPADQEQMLSRVDQFTDALEKLTDRVRFVFVPAWVIPSYHRGFGMMDLKPACGVSAALMKMNLRLAENLGDLSDFFVLDSSRWLSRAGKNAVNPKLWYMGKIAFSPEVFAQAVSDIKSALNGLAGNARKLVVVDLDDTLWGGIVGDDGWENLKLGGHDFIGEAFADFQRALKALTNRGVLLGIVSKNEESVALEAIEKHPEMILRTDDFAGWRINWNDKAQNLVELVEDLNLGLQSVVFLDDNPVERARVRETLPEVLVPEMPGDKTLYAKTLLELNCFDTPALSKEDVERARMYVSERKRKDLQSKISSPEEWLRSLEVKVGIQALNNANRERTVQLLNKTNQMNLTTRRMSEKELTDWLKKDNRHLWTLRVSDRYGDSGLTGIVSVEIDGDTARIIDFVLSCRVFGRKIEHFMVRRVYDLARSQGLKQINADFVATQKNKPCFDFWTSSGFEHDKDKNRFSWPVDKEYPFPAEIQAENLD